MTNRRGFLGGVAAIGTAAIITTTATATFAGSMSVVSAGTFEGRSNHVTSGGVKVIEEDGRWFVELGEDFSLDGGPDPRVGFGKDGEYIREGYLGALVSLTGKQRYAVPPTWKLADFNEVYIWCEVASVPLGVAAIK